VVTITASAQHHLFDGIVSSNYCDLFFNSTQLQIYSGGAAYVTVYNQETPFIIQGNGTDSIGSPLIPATKKYQLFRVEVNGIATTAYLDGVPSGLSGDPGSQPLNGFALASHPGVGSGLLTGGVSSLLVYSGVPDSTTTREIENYLNSFQFNETKPQIVCHGDSLTYGSFLQDPTTQCFPVQLNSILGSSWDIYNQGLAGEPLSFLLGVAFERIDPLYRSFRSQNWVIIWAGVNDMLGFNPSTPDTPAVVYNNLKTYCNQRKAIGFKVMVATLPPSSYAGTAASYESSRLSFNSMVRANYISFADEILDIGGDHNLGNPANTATNTIDGLHFNATSCLTIAKMAAPYFTTASPPPSHRFLAMSSIRDTVYQQALRQKNLDVVWYRNNGETSSEGDMWDAN
jgi:lysophospholipase L1-like esterase